MLGDLKSDSVVVQHDFHCVVTKRAVNINGITYNAVQPLSSQMPMLFCVGKLMPGVELAIDTIKGSIAIGFPNEIILGRPLSRAARTRPFRRLPGSCLAARRQGHSSALERHRLRDT